MKNKLLYILIFILLIILVTKEYKKINSIKYQNKIIQTYDNYKNIYEGYIEIPKYNIKRLIKNGTSNKILDNNYVGIMKQNNNLTILVGHNINLVFHKIHYLKKGDIIYLYQTYKEKYKVINMKEVNENDSSDLYKNYNDKTLILITCTKDKNKRYMVIAKQIKNG